MWCVVYGTHWVYHTHKVHRYETAKWYLAFLVYAWWQCRYSFSVYPVKYLKIYKVDSNVVSLKSYGISEAGDYERLKRKRRR